MYTFKPNHRNSYHYGNGSRRRSYKLKSSMPTYAWFVKTGLTEPDYRQELQAALKDIKGYLYDCGCENIKGSITDEDGVLRIFYTPKICNANILEVKLKKNFPYEWVRRENKRKEYTINEN